MSAFFVFRPTHRLQNNESLSASEAAREARSEMEENVGIQKAQDDLVRDLNGWGRPPNRVEFNIYRPIQAKGLSLHLGSAAFPLSRGAPTAVKGWHQIDLQCSLD